MHVFQDSVIKLLKKCRIPALHAAIVTATRAAYMTVLPRIIPR